MRPARLGAIAVLLCLVGDTPAPHSAKPTSNAVTDRGESLLQDDFSNGASPPWTFDRKGVWTVEDGHLRAELPKEKQQRSFAFVGSEDWNDYALDLDVCGL